MTTPSASAGLSTAEIKEKLKSIGLPSSGSRVQLEQRFDEFFSGTSLLKTEAPAVPVEAPVSSAKEEVKGEIKGEKKEKEEKKDKKEKKEKPDDKKEKKEAKKEKKAPKESSAKAPGRKRKAAQEAFVAFEDDDMEAAVAAQPATPEATVDDAGEKASPAKLARSGDGDWWDSAADGDASKAPKQVEAYEEAFWDDDDAPAEKSSAAQSSSAGDGGVFKAVYKTTMCKNIINYGHCMKGQACIYAHSREEIRVPSSNLSTADPLPVGRVGDSWRSSSSWAEDRSSSSWAEDRTKQLRQRGLEIAQKAPETAETADGEKTDLLAKVRQWQFENGREGWQEFIKKRIGRAAFDPSKHDNEVLRAFLQATENGEVKGEAKPWESKGKGKGKGKDPKQNLCKRYEMFGFCRAGAECRFAHGAWEVPGAKAELEWHDWTKGGCGPDYEQHPMVSYLMGENVDPITRHACIEQLAKNCLEATQEDPGFKNAWDVTREQLAVLKKRFDEAIEEPLRKYSQHLRPALFRRVHVGTMDYMDETHESYRKTFDFLETTNTWHDLDREFRKVGPRMQEIGCAYQQPNSYNELAKKAQEGFTMVVKVSCVATHIKKLAEPEQWWPKLYWDKYSKLKSATVAYLWQLPPMFRYEEGSLPSGKMGSLQKLQYLMDYLETEASMAKGARRIIDFRHESWYREETYELLRSKKWCLAWLHLNNNELWASRIPSGWTDRVQTTDFVYMRLFGPDGRTHGTYDKAFLHQLFDSCPMGTTSYVLFGNRELLDDENPVPRPAVTNAFDFRTIFSKMDFVTRIRDVRYRGKCPRLMDKEERLLVNSFYLRFAQRARSEGVSIVTPVASTKARKYYPKAPDEKRSFEWLMDTTKDRRLHLSLHDIREESDIWRHLRQLSGCEHLDTAKKLIYGASKKAIELERTAFEPIWEACAKVVTQMCPEERSIISGAFVRWSEKARQAGLLATTELKAIEPEDDEGNSPHSRVRWLLKKRTTTTTEDAADDEKQQDDELVLSTRDLLKSQDVWKEFRMLSRMSDQTVNHEKEQTADPWQDTTWKRLSGEMFKRPFKPTGPRPKKPAPLEAKKEENENSEGGWGELWEEKDGKRPREEMEDEEVATVKRMRLLVADPEQLEKQIRQKKVEYVWAKTPLDTNEQLFKAVLVCEHKTGVAYEKGSISVHWCNGSTEHTLVRGWDIDVFKYREGQPPPDIKSYCSYCHGAGIFRNEEGQDEFCSCTRGIELYDEQLASEQRVEEEYNAWIRVEMKLQPGQYMYKNQVTGRCITELPPSIAQEWQEGQTPDGRTIYQHLATGHQQEELPPIQYELDSQTTSHLDDSVAIIHQRLEMLIKKNSRVALTEDELAEVDKLQGIIDERDREVATMM